MGWDYWTMIRQPLWLLELVMMRMNLEGEESRRKVKEMQKNGTS